MDLVEILKALADENRIRILNILKSGELCVGEIQHILEMTQSNVSRHLNKLYSLKIITYEKKAQWVYYKINCGMLKEYPFIQELMEVEFSKIQKCIEDKEKLQCYRKSGMTCEELKECRENLKCTKQM